MMTAMAPSTAALQGAMTAAVVAAEAAEQDFMRLQTVGHHQSADKAELDALKAAAGYSEKRTAQTLVNALPDSESAKML